MKYKYININIKYHLILYKPFCITQFLPLLICLDNFTLFKTKNLCVMFTERVATLDLYT